VLSSERKQHCYFPTVLLTPFRLQLVPTLVQTHLACHCFRSSSFAYHLLPTPSTPLHTHYIQTQTMAPLTAPCTGFLPLSSLPFGLDGKYDPRCFVSPRRSRSETSLSLDSHLPLLVFLIVQVIYETLAIAFDVLIQTRVFLPCEIFLNNTELAAGRIGHIRDVPLFWLRTSLEITARRPLNRKP
jgi:hypothetical protein